MGINLGPLNIKDTYEQLVQISGSQLTDGTGSLIPNLTVTASFASQAGTAGYAATAGNAGTASTAISASFASQAGTAGFATQAGTSGFAVSSSFASQAGTAGFASQAGTAGFAVTSSLALTSLITASYSNPNLTFTKGDGSTFGVVISTNVPSLQAVTDIGNQTTNDIIITGSLVTTEVTASGAISASTYFGDGSNLTGIATTLQAVTDNGATTTNKVFFQNGIEVTGSIAVKSGSFGGTAIDNLTTPTASEAIQHVVSLTAIEYAAIPVPDPNTLYIINDVTGSLVLGNTVISGSLTVTGTLTAPGLTVPTASFANTASVAITALNGFPYTGSAEITGSLKVIGTTTITGSLLQGSTGNSVTDPNSAIIAAGNGNTVSATQAAILGGVGSNSNSAGGGVMIATDRSSMSGGYGLVAGVDSATHGGTGNVTLGGEQHNMAGDDNAIIAGVNNNVNGNNNAVVGGKNNTVSSSYTGSVVLGGTGLSATKNEEVVVPNLTVYGTIDGPGAYNPTSEVNKLLVSTTYTQTLNASAASTIYNLHISESGIHYISSSIASPGSASVNLYWYLDSIPTGSSAAVMVSLPSGTAAAGLIVRSITTGSAGTQFYVPSTSFTGTTNLTINRATIVTPRQFPSSVATPAVFSKLYNGTIYMGTVSNPVVSTGGQTYLYSGSVGSPIV